MYEPFVEQLASTNSFIHTRVGNWLHILDNRTGEGDWIWLGKFPSLLVHKMEEPCPKVNETSTASSTTNAQ